jgi:hypothetical protein
MCHNPPGFDGIEAGLGSLLGSLKSDSRESDFNVVESDSLTSFD